SRVRAAVAPEAVAVGSGFAAAAAGATIGAKGTPCQLPFSFQTAADWKAKAVDVKKLGEFAELARVGDFTVICEIDAKPAGSIGFLRVHLADGLSGAPRDHLAAFVKASSRSGAASTTTYTDVQIGGAQAAEVTWERKDEELDLEKKYTAFALNTKRGAVVVQLAPFDSGEHTAMLPAYELARKSVKIQA
ncbi:lipoprotein, partial [Actinoplanes xinjiangensis]|uniref:lipoprotein n=1 Tax=Actinoplanes xinjiangensis TaxID=512350 RepID=UPI0034208FE1